MLKTEQDHSSLPNLLPKTPCAFTWSGHTLSLPEWETKNSYDLYADLSLEQALAKLSTSCSFTKKLEVSKAAQKSFQEIFSEETFFKEAGYTRLDLIEEIKTVSTNLPIAFLNWCDSKKLNLKDFRVFLKDFNQDTHSPFFEKLAQLEPTKNLGLQILEYYFDLLAVEKVSTSVLMDFKNPEKLFSFLKKKRFSESMSQDKKIQEDLSKLEFSPGVKVEMKRNGDKRQLKFEIQVDSPDQLFQKIEKTKTKLESLKEIWGVKK
jgi:hypothetical protein